MRFALDLARMVKGQTNPNPPVGAVVIKDGEILGFGAHLKAGKAHAEVHALHLAGSKAKGATMYVTLEPCNHHGRTSPCVDLVIEKGIKRVVVAMVDPNEKVANKGIAKLKQAGIDVDVGVMQREAEQINEAFIHYITTKTPFVTLKTAISLDGKTATVTGESKWITGENARLDVHHYRHTHDGILVGVNTVNADDPSLTTRLPNGGNNPVRIILDTHLRTPIHAKVITDKEAYTWIFTGNHVTKHQKEKFIKYTHVRVIQLEDEKITIDKVLKRLGRKGIMSLFVEGGAEVNGAFLKERKINQLIFYMAPKILGGKNAPTSFAGEGFQSILEALELNIRSIDKLGEDIKIVAIPQKEDSDVYWNY